MDLWVQHVETTPQITPGSNGPTKKVCLVVNHPICGVSPFDQHTRFTGFLRILYIPRPSKYHYDLRFVSVLGGLHISLVAIMVSLTDIDA
jgi:hypothetical protein